MTGPDAIESAILRMLSAAGPCTVEQLTQALPNHTWNEIFAAVDRLSRSGRVTLHCVSRFGYLVAIEGAGEGP